MRKNRTVAGSDRGINIAPERLFSDAICNIVFCESLKRADPKIHDRMRGHLEAAKKELFRLIRKDRRARFSKVVNRLRLDPDGPLPNGLVEKFNRKYNSLIKIERRACEIDSRCS